VEILLKHGADPSAVDKCVRARAERVDRICSVSSRRLGAQERPHATAVRCRRRVRGHRPEGVLARGSGPSRRALTPSPPTAAERQGRPLQRGRQWRLHRVVGRALQDAGAAARAGAAQGDRANLVHSPALWKQSPPSSVRRMSCAPPLTAPRRWVWLRPSATRSWYSRESAGGRAGLALFDATDRLRCDVQVRILVEKGKVDVNNAVAPGGDTALHISTHEGAQKRCVPRARTHNVPFLCR
jgi:hypothetical protein